MKGTDKRPQPGPGKRNLIDPPVFDPSVHSMGNPFSRKDSNDIAEYIKQQMEKQEEFEKKNPGKLYRVFNDGSIELID